MNEINREIEMVLYIIKGDSDKCLILIEKIDGIKKII